MSRDAVTWPALLARLDRVNRQRRIARFLLRLFRLNEIEALPVGEYAVAFGYVTLCNDQAVVLAAARRAAAAEPDAAAGYRLDLRAAIELFDDLHPHGGLG